MSQNNNSSHYVWLNNRIIPENSAHISKEDRGFLLGDGVFDTMAAIQGQPIEAELHFQRLSENCAIMNLNTGYEQRRWLQQIEELINKNNLNHKYASIRTTITRGRGQRGLLPAKCKSPTILITAKAFNPHFMARPARVIISTKTRRNEGSPLSQIKSLNYGDNIIARMEAAELGADEALLLNNKNVISCGTSSNVFIAVNDEVYTPPLSDGVLNGIVRQKILSMAAPKSRIIEKSITAEDAENAKAVFITNSLIGIRPVSHLNGTEIPIAEISDIFGDI